MEDREHELTAKGRVRTIATCVRLPTEIGKRVEAAMGLEARATMVVESKIRDCTSIHAVSVGSTS